MKAVCIYVDLDVHSFFKCKIVDEENQQCFQRGSVAACMNEFFSRFFSFVLCIDLANYAACFLVVCSARGNLL